MKVYKELQRLRQEVGIACIDLRCTDSGFCLMFPLGNRTAMMQGSLFPDPVQVMNFARNKWNRRSPQQPFLE